MAKYRLNRKLSAFLTNPLVAILIVALAVTGGVMLAKSRGTVSEYFCQGVYINNVDMSCYTKAQGEAQLEAWSNSVLGAEYILTCGDSSWSFCPADMDASYNISEVLANAWNLGHTGSASDMNLVQQQLRQTPQYFYLTFTYSEKKLDKFIDKIEEAVYVEPVDADIVLSSTQPIVVGDSVDGQELDSEALKETLLGLMQYGSTSRVIELPVVAKAAAVSSDSAQDGLQLIVTYSTSLTESSTARCGNVRLALSNFNGFEVKPGEVVSFNEIVGERSTLRGYVEGAVYSGTSVTTGIGGGVCQASSTLYGAMMYAGCDVVERHHHTLIVGYCDASMDAAVSETALDDFVFQNNTENTMYIYTEVVNKERATVYVYSNRPEYRIELVSTILQSNIKNPEIDTVKDYTGTYAYYTDQHVLKETGKLGRRSMLERVYYDWDTGAEVKRETLSEDYYSGERDTYYVGVHDPVTGEIVS